MNIKKWWLGLLCALWIPYIADLISLIINSLNLKLNMVFSFVDFFANIISQLASIPTMTLIGLALYDLSNKLGYYGFLLLLIIATFLTFKDSFDL